MKITVQHDIDDLNLAEDIAEVRKAPVGARAAVLTAGNYLMLGLFVGSLGVTQSNFLFGWPAPGVAIRWVALLGMALVVVAGCWSFLSARFAERHILGPTGLASATYELRPDGVMVTTEAGRTLIYWSPGSTVENDSKRLYITCGSGSLLVIPARAFASHAEFEAFEAGALACLKAAGEGSTDAATLSA